MAGERLIGESGSIREEPEVYVMDMLSEKLESEVELGIIHRLGKELLLKWLLQAFLRLRGIDSTMTEKNSGLVDPGSESS